MWKNCISVLTNRNISQRNRQVIVDKRRTGFIKTSGLKNMFKEKIHSWQAKVNSSVRKFIMILNYYS